MTQFTKGMQFNCPHCNQDSLVKLETEMDGWTKVGEYFACAMCSEKLQDVEEEAAPTPNTSDVDDSRKKSLLDFLGTDESSREEILDDDGKRRFCRDCTHLLEHPFKVYCLLHKKSINPMDDCPEFNRKKA